MEKKHEIISKIYGIQKQLVHTDRLFGIFRRKRYLIEVCVCIAHVFEIRNILYFIYYNVHYLFACTVNPSNMGRGIKKKNKKNKNPVSIGFPISILYSITGVGTKNASFPYYTYIPDRKIIIFLIFTYPFYYPWCRLVFRRIILCDCVATREY